MASTDDRLRAFYDLRAAEEPAGDPEALLRFDKALAAAGLRPGERVLDLGAKSGGLGVQARKTGFDVEYTGLDLSEANGRTAASLTLAYGRRISRSPCRSATRSTTASSVWSSSST